MNTRWNDSTWDCLTLVLCALLLCGCVRGDLNVYYGGRRVAQVSNVQHTVTADINAAQEATPGWLSRVCKLAAAGMGVPEAAGGGAAVVLTGLWLRIRAKRKAKQ